MDPGDHVSTTVDRPLLEELEGIERAFTGSPRTRSLLPLLRRIPPPLASGAMAAMALADGLRRGRFRRAVKWAEAHGASRTSRYRIAAALLANHGRFVAQESMLGLGGVEALRAGSTVRGGEQLTGIHGGALLLGLHVGPPRSWLYLRAHGYPVCFLLRDSAGEGPAWERIRREGMVIAMPVAGDAAGRVQGLYRMRRVLREGGLVFMAADGPVGSTLFTLDVPAAPVIRDGWFHLRRQLRVPVFPTLVHESSGRRIVTVHPPLPEMDEDPDRDAAACRAVLSGILRDYVSRWPSQCRYLAFPPWGSGSGVGAE